MIKKKGGEIKRKEREARRGNNREDNQTERRGNEE